MGDKKIVLRSLIKKHFTEDILVKLYLVTLRSDISNNGKVSEIHEILNEAGIQYVQLGPGTNRYAVNIDGYAVKIALDKDGQIDNQREFLYSKNLQPYVIKVYECTVDGLVMVCERVQPFNVSDIKDEDTQEKMRKILKLISSQYMIGDMGISEVNYINWGYKDSGQLCILDFAYIYATKYTKFNCTCGDGTNILQYDNNYDSLICPVCGKKWEFKKLRRRITRKEQEAEIGDIRRLGYTLSKEINQVSEIEKFRPPDELQLEEEERALSSKESKWKHVKELEKSLRPYKYKDIPYMTYEEILEELNQGGK